MPCAVLVIVTKVRTGGSVEELVVVEDSVDDEVEIVNVGGKEKETVETSMVLEMVALVVDEVCAIVEAESLRIVNEATAASAVGFGCFFPGIGFSTVIAEVEGVANELSGAAVGVTAGAVTKRGSSVERKIGNQCLSPTYIIRPGRTLIHSGNRH